MSRFQSSLNAKQQKQYLSPQSRFSARTHKAGQVPRVLGANNFHISEIVERNTHIWIRLGCGAVVAVYVPGTVLIQGRIYGCGAAEAEKLLRAILPAPLVWQARIDA